MKIVQRSVELSSQSCLYQWIICEAYFLGWSSCQYLMTCSAFRVGNYFQCQHICCFNSISSIWLPRNQGGMNDREGNMISRHVEHFALALVQDSSVAKSRKCESLRVGVRRNNWLSVSCSSYDVWSSDSCWRDNRRSKVFWSGNWMWYDTWDSWLFTPKFPLRLWKLRSIKLLLPGTYI